MVLAQPLSDQMAKAAKQIRAHVEADYQMTLLDMHTLAHMIMHWSERVAKLERPPVAAVVRLPVALRVVGQ